MGAQYRESNIAGVGDASIANAGAYLRVKAVSQATDGTITFGACGVNDEEFGVMDNQKIFAAGAQINVNLRNDNKTRIYQTSTAITALSLVFAGALGTIAQTGSVPVGIALTAASGSGSNIEVLPFNSLANSSGNNVVPTALAGAADAISPHLTQKYIVTKAGVDAMTLAAPTATTDDGVEITIVSNTANAHTLTATGLLGTGAAAVNLATFAAHPGASVTLQAYQGKWNVVSQNAITFT